MLIPATAHCYQVGFLDGQVDLDITEVTPGWYRIEQDQIESLRGSFRLKPHDGITRCYLELKLPNGIEIKTYDGNITASKRTLSLEGSISTPYESGRPISPTELKSLLIDRYTLICLYGSEQKFIPNNKRTFSRRPNGFCNIYCSLEKSVLPYK